MHTNLRVRVFVAVLVTAAAGMLVGSATLASVPPWRDWIWGAVVFGLLFALTEYHPVPLLGRHGASSFTMSDVPAFGLLFVAPAPVALAIIGGCAWAVDRLSAPDRPRVKATFNAAASTVGYGLGLLVLSLLIDLPPDRIGVAVVGATLAAGGVTLLLTSALTTTVIALDASTPVRHVLRDSITLNDLRTHYLLISLAPIVVAAWAYDRALVAVIVVVMVGVYRATLEGVTARTQALKDSTTGLPNRAALDQRVAHLLRQLEGEDTLSLLLLDLDEFQAVNERLGQGFGDRLLHLVGRRLDAAPHVDTAARLDGDAFAVLVRRGDADHVREVAAALLTEVAEPYTIDGVPVRVGASIGVAVAPADGHDATALLRVADAALTTAKRRGSAPHVHLSSGYVRRRVPGRLSVLGEVEAALADGQLRLDYQPQVALDTGAVAGLEALLRWRHPEHGDIAPGVFMDALEHTDLMPMMTRFVLDRAAVDLATLRVDGFDGTVSVNVSARDLHNRRLADEVDDVLRRRDIPHDRLIIEVTESTFVTDNQRARHVMHELAELRVGRSLDDFGTGYSSLAALGAIPLTELKIDRAFVTGLAHGASATSILQAIIDLARRLELTSVAEGVETTAEQQVLRRLGCQLVQGYLVARPMALEAVPGWLAAHDPARVAATR